MNKKSKQPFHIKNLLGSIGTYFIIAVVLFISIYPILWVFISSFKYTDLLFQQLFDNRYFYTDQYYGSRNVSLYFRQNAV